MRIFRWVMVKMSDSDVRWCGNLYYLKRYYLNLHQFIKTPFLKCSNIWKKYIVIFPTCWSQWAKMKKKVHFVRTMHCLHQRPKSMFFEKFSSGGSQKRIWSEEKISKNIDFCLWGNRATTESVYGWLHDYFKD